MGRLRRAQEAQGEQGPRRGRYHRPPAGAARYPGGCQRRDLVAVLAAAVQEATGERVEVAFVDQAYTGPSPEAAAEHGIRLEVVRRLPEAMHGFVLLPRRRVVERSFAWASRFRRLAQDYERLLGLGAGEPTGPSVSA